MLIIAYILTGISALGGLLASAVGFILSWTLIQGHGGKAEIIAAIIIAIMSLIYLTHPLIAIYWIQNNQPDQLGWCIVYDIMLIGVSSVACYLGTIALSAAAQP